ncbi:MAG: hypothetical protein IJ268_12655 [Proteobacteria bacterium]|nr:hypothetical protein [Pseudomonadota bacterium]
MKHANLRQAVKTSDRAKIEEFIANGETIPNRALAWSNDIGTTKLLIAHGADPQKVDRDRQNALFGCQSVEIAKLLIEHGADAKITDLSGRPPYLGARTYRLQNCSSNTALIQRLLTIADAMPCSDAMTLKPDVCAT